MFVMILIAVWVYTHRSAEAPDTPFPNVDGLHVLAVHDVLKDASLPQGQLEAILSLSAAGAVNDFLQSHAAHEKSGDLAVRVFDVDQNVDNELAEWKQQFSSPAQPRTSLPWLTVSNGRTGYDGPFPKDANALITLLKKYGG